MDKNDLDGMTVNERLFVLNLIDDFDRAAKARNSETMIAILLKASLTEAQAKFTTEAILKNPEKYGF
jgi:hypothetical protein